MGSAGYRRAPLVGFGWRLLKLPGTGKFYGRRRGLRVRGFGNLSLVARGWLWGRRVELSQRRAQRITGYLARHNMNPEQFAAKVGVHATTIYRLLAGVTIPKRKNLKAILAATDGEVSINELMRRLFVEAKECWAR